MNKIRIGVVGYQGRMGKQITSTILESSEAMFASGASRETYKNNEAIVDKSVDKNADIKSVSSIFEVFQDSDVVIEFTNHTTMKECLEASAETTTPLVSGTTGHDHYELMRQIAKTTPILWAANMSVGINILSKLVKEVAKKLDEDYDIEISEMHHAHKKDAPSGTSIMLGKAAAEGRNVDFESAKSIVRDGVRAKGDIGFAALRGGGVYGEHKVMFIGEDEYIELGHVSLTRKLFAKGAVKAALWLNNKEAGLYSMQNVLDE